MANSLVIWAQTQALQILRSLWVVIFQHSHHLQDQISQVDGIWRHVRQREAQTEESVKLL